LNQNHKQAETGETKEKHPKHRGKKTQNKLPLVGEELICLTAARSTHHKIGCLGLKLVIQCRVKARHCERNQQGKCTKSKVHLNGLQSCKYNYLLRSKWYCFIALYLYTLYIMNNVIYMFCDYWLVSLLYIYIHMHFMR
jgi:hypothetical protein